MACPGPYLLPTANSTAANDTVACPFVNRTGEVQHEVKFVPNQADEEFTPPRTGVSNDYNQTKSSLVAVYRATPAQQIVFEVTAVYELESQVFQSVANSVTPPSSVTLNQLLRALGPVSSWAYSNVVAPTLRAMAGKANSNVYSAVSAASRAVALLAV
jgi:hypothetical protein